MARPKFLLALFLLFLGFAGFNLVGAVMGWTELRFLRRLPLSVSPLYLIMGDAVWAAIFFGVTVGLWRLNRWAWYAGLMALPFYFAHGWLNRLLLSRSDFAHQPLLWAAAWTGLWIALAWGILWRPKVRQLFWR
jgi:hypothetical protein